MDSSADKCSKGHVLADVGVYTYDRRRKNGNVYTQTVCKACKRSHDKPPPSSRLRNLAKKMSDYRRNASNAKAPTTEAVALEILRLIDLKERCAMPWERAEVQARIDRLSGRDVFDDRQHRART